MPPLHDIAPLFAGFLVVLAIGYLLRRSGRLPPAGADALNVVVVDVTLPALILATLNGRPLAWSAARAVLASAIALLAAFALALLLARALRLGRPARAAAALASSFSNTSFLGIPLILALYPRDPVAAPTAVVIDAFITTLGLYTLGVAWARREGEGRAEPTVSPLRGLVSPATVSVLVALALNIAHVRLPDAIERPLLLLGNATAPLVFLALGMRLDLGALRGRARALVAIAAIKQLVAPAVALGAAIALGLRGSEAQVTVLESAMPTSMMSAVIAARYGCDGALGTAAVVTTLLLSAATLPLWMALMRWFGI
jgi:hypothetical protein